MLQLVLASSSPRRKELLEAAGIDFAIRVAPVDETRLANEPGPDYVLRLARLKAEAVELHAGEVILAADTTVVCGGEILEKPGDADDAARMLRILSGRIHEVITGVCFRNSEGTRTAMELTRVHFRTLCEEDIRHYVSTKEPLDKAGAYAIQGIASRYVDRIEGCYFNVVGLPVSLVWKLLGEIRS